MKDLRGRAKQYNAAVCSILLHAWDPIGVTDIPEAQDEYDMYASEIASLLMRGESRQKLIDHLWLIETENIGLPGNRPRTEAAADRLLQLRHEIDGDA
jgi:hypothetical protein